MIRGREAGREGGREESGFLFLPLRMLLQVLTTRGLEEEYTKPDLAVLREVREGRREGGRAVCALISISSFLPPSLSPSLPPLFKALEDGEMCEAGVEMNPILWYLSLRYVLSPSLPPSLYILYLYIYLISILTSLPLPPSFPSFLPPSLPSAADRFKALYGHFPGAKEEGEEGKLWIVMQVGREGGREGGRGI